MSREGLPEKWIDDLDAQEPVTDAAQRVLEKRVGMVSSMIKSVVKSRGEENDSVHQLRVSTRRAQAGLEAFKPWVRRERSRDARRAMKRLRGAAGAVRMCDVHRSLLAEMLKNANDEERAAIEVALMLLAADAHRARHELFEAAKRRSARRLPSGSGRWLRRGRSKSCDATTGDEVQTTPVTACAADLRHAGDAALADLARDFLMAAEQDLSQRDNLHRMRLHGKTLRYAVEIFGATATHPEALVQMHEGLIHLQDRLGVINDYEEVGHRLARYAGNLETEIGGSRNPADAKVETAAPSHLAPVMRRLADHFESRCNQGIADFLEWWLGEEASNFRRLLAELATASGGASDSAAGEPSTTQPEQVNEPASADREAVIEQPDAEVVVLAQRNGACIEPALASAVRNGDDR